MLTIHRALVCACTITASVQLHASPILRCEDAQGHITYSQHGCPENQSEQPQAAHNPRPAGSGQGVEMATPARTRAGMQAFQTQGIGTPDDGCGNRLDRRSRREAIIKGQVRTGMSQADIESALGKPDRISRQNGSTRYHYPRKSGRAQQVTVTFDENGCVKPGGR